MAGVWCLTFGNAANVLKGFLNIPLFQILWHLSTRGSLWSLHICCGKNYLLGILGWRERLSARRLNTKSTKDTVTLVRISQPSKTQRGPGTLFINELINCNPVISDQILVQEKFSSGIGWHCPTLQTIEFQQKLEQSTAIFHHPQLWKLFNTMNTLNFRLTHGKINMSLITFFHTCHHIGTTWYNYVISRGHFYPILPIWRKIGLPVYVNRFACKHCPLLHPNPGFMLAQAEVKHITNTDGLGYTTLRCGFLNSFHLMSDEGYQCESGELYKTLGISKLAYGVILQNEVNCKCPTLD